MSDVSAFAAKCNRLTSTLPNAVNRTAGVAGLAVKTSWLGISASNGMTPGGTIARRKWGVGYTVMGGTGASTLVAFRGPVHLVMRPTAPHVIAPKGKGRRRRKALKINGGFAKSVSHPGTRGKNFWPDCVKAANSVAPQTFRNALFPMVFREAGFG